MAVRRPRIVRLLSAALACAALGFVIWVVPIRDRCWDPRAPKTTHVSVSRQPSSCILHLRSGDVEVDATECARLTCEPGVASTWSHVRVGTLGWLLGLYALGTLAWAARWRALLGLAGLDLGLLQAWRVSVEAQAGGVLMPGGIGGDALRVAWVIGSAKRAGLSSPTAIVIASVVLDRCVGLAVIAGVASTLGIASGGLHAGPMALVMASIPFAFVAGIALLRWIPMELVPWLTRGPVGERASPILGYVRAPNAPRAIAIAAALSILVAGVQFATIRGLIFAFGATVTAETWVYVGTAMVFVVGAIPALPGAWGTADVAYVFFLGLAGVSAGTALGVSLMYRLFWYVSAVVGALLYLVRARDLDELGAAPSPGLEPRP